MKDWHRAGVSEVQRGVYSAAPRVCSPSMPRNVTGAQRVSSFEDPNMLSQGRRSRLENITCALNTFRRGDACSPMRLESTARDWRSIILDKFSVVLAPESHASQTVRGRRTSSSRLARWRSHGRQGRPCIDLEGREYRVS